MFVSSERLQKISSIRSGLDTRNHYVMIKSFIKSILTFGKMIHRSYCTGVYVL